MGSILVRYAELGLKSRSVRRRFESILVDNLMSCLANAGLEGLVTTEYGRIFVEVDDPERAGKALARVFGVSSVPSLVPPITRTDIKMFNIPLIFFVRIADQEKRMVGKSATYRSAQGGIRIACNYSGGCSMRNRKGFTLMEIMIVLVIVGILAAISIPNVTAWVHHLRFTGFLRDVYTEFQDARTRAKAVGIPHEVVVDAGANTVRVRRATDNVWVRAAVTAPGTCDIVSGSSVLFRTNGTTSNSGNVRIVSTKSAADNNMITVTLGTGRIAIQ